MEKIDGRGLSREALEERRRTIIRKKIVVYYLPPYSPDLNPDEHLNSDVKYGVGSKTPKRTREGLRKATEEHMNMLNESSERIAKYFEDPAIQYAA